MESASPPPSPPSYGVFHNRQKERIKCKGCEKRRLSPLRRPRRVVVVVVVVDNNDDDDEGEIIKIRNPGR
jgi:hypothetical protein